MDTFPLFGKKLLKEQDDSSFLCYLTHMDNVVSSIQSSSNSKTEIPLTFYPIAKNVRTAASYMALNLLNGNASYLENMARNGEPGFWHSVKNMGNWFPWLWARGRVDGDYKNIDGWKYYFTSFSKNQPLANANAIPIKPPDNLTLFFAYLSCLKYVFQFNDAYNTMMANYKKEMNWPTDKKVLAVQIRRGETCSEDGSLSPDRPFYHVDKYIESIEELLQHNDFEYIYISTDSDLEINYIQKLRPEWKLLYLPIDRTQFFRLNGTLVDLEVSCTMNPERIPFIVDSGLADLYFISQSQGYISTISMSEFSRCGWYLQLAFQGKLTPYVNMNGDILDMSVRDKLLLL
jgi:ssDNA-specific exonuclease RecJ